MAHFLRAKGANRFGGAQIWRRIAVGFCLLAGIAWVSDEGARAQSLREAFISAYENSDLLEQHRAILRASDEDYISLKASLEPVITYALTPNHTSPKPSFQKSAGKMDASLVARWRLFDFGRTETSKRSAAAMVEAARHTLLDFEQVILLDAANAYFDYKSALENYRLEQRNVALIEAHLRAARDRYKVGKVTRTDVTQAEARLAQAEAKRVSARGTLIATEQTYGLAVGVSEVPKKLGADGLPKLPFSSQSEVLDAALAENPKFKAQQSLSKARAIAVELSDMGLRPTLDFTTTLTNDLNASSSKTNAVAGISLSGTIYNGVLPSGKRKAVAQHAAEMAALRLLGKQIQQQAITAWSGYRVARQHLAAAKEAVRANEAAYEGVSAEAKLGSRTVLDVLNAEQELLNAKTALIEANATLSKAHYVVLARVGRLTAKALELDVALYDPDENFRAHSGGGLADAEK